MMWSKQSQSLAFKLFISYLVVLLVGIAALAATVEIVIPRAFDRHMAGMQSMMGMMGRMDMFNRFRSGVNESMAVAALVALLAAVLASIFISQRVVSPVRAISAASLRIAAGHFDQRVVIPAGGLSYTHELAQLAHSFNQMAEQLQHTEKMRLQLLGDVSHELRTPLTAIKGSMEALIDGVLPAEPETFRKIEEEADRLQRLVADLQELSRVESGAYELECHPLAIGDLVEAALHRMEQTFQQKNISLVANLSPNLPVVSADRDRLLQVLINLLDNACRYTPSGGKVSIEAKRQGSEVILAVRDSGMGVQPEHLPLLFTRFYRVDKSRSHQPGGGSGVGLTIARHLVEAHGGRLWAESQGLGQGSTFIFSLPVLM